MSFFSESTGKNVLPISRYFYIGLLSMIRMQFGPNDLSFGSFEVMWGQIWFLLLTFDRRRTSSICFVREDATAGMQYDLLGSTHDPK